MVLKAASAKYFWFLHGSLHLSQHRTTPTPVRTNTRGEQILSTVIMQLTPRMLEKNWSMATDRGKATQGTKRMHLLSDLMKGKYVALKEQLKTGKSDRNC